MWPEQPFEKQLHEALLNSEDFDSLTGDKYYDHYKQARNYLVDKVYPMIPALEPDLTDHTDKHIRDVMKNVHLLLKHTYASVPPMDLYILGLCVLFHDAGLLLGRKNHADYDIIAKVYDNAFPNDPAFVTERRAVSRAASAHTGKATDGSNDTLKDISETVAVDGYPIRLREIATILRFADELAEGAQRTSQFMQDHNLYKRDSLVYHLYANTVSVHIDRPHQRIALTFDFKINFGAATFDWTLS